MIRKLSRKDDTGRQWRSFKRHAFLVCRAFVTALIPVILWRVLRSNEYHFVRADESAIGFAIATVGVAYGIIAALVLQAVWEKYRKVVIAVFDRDKRTFLMYRDERMPIMIHILLAALSFPLLLLVVMLDYENIFSGIASVFSVSFMIVLYWIIATELENPAKSPWFAERIPKEWLAEDVDKFFALDKNNGGGDDREGEHY